MLIFLFTHTQEGWGIQEDLQAILYKFDNYNSNRDLYSHLLDGMDDEAANKIDQALRAAMKKRD